LRGKASLINRERHEKNVLNLGGEKKKEFPGSEAPIQLDISVLCEDPKKYLRGG